MKNVQLLIIDGQNDFLDPMGALYVQGADVEAEKLASMIDWLGNTISCIHSTMDAHHLIDVAHPQMWIDDHGNHPEPFTIISENDVTKSRWRCTLRGYFDAEKKITYQGKVTKYVQELTKWNCYPLCIWPPHCLIGSSGQNVFPPLFEAYCRWVEKQPRWINFVTKGVYPFSDQDSAIQANVPEPNVPETHFNTDLLSNLDKADIVLWAGWAGSHCLANTCRVAVNYFGDGSNELAKKSVLLTDVSAAVSDHSGSTMFHDLRESFVKEMKDRGMKLATSEDVFG